MMFMQCHTNDGYTKLIFLYCWYILILLLVHSCLRQFSSGMTQMCAMGLKWNMAGDMITALRRRMSPVLYHVRRTSAIAEFHHPGYSNVCTMKSNCFAGSKDQVTIRCNETLCY